MKKWLAGAVLLLILVVFPPFHAADAGQLWVVETLMVEEMPKGFTVYAGELSGQGRTIGEALSTLQEYAPGELFLRQVKRLVLCGDTALPVLPEEIPMGAVVYTWPGSGGELWQRLSRVEPVLDARERQNDDQTRLADLEDAALGQKTVRPEILKWEMENAS